MNLTLTVSHNIFLTTQQRYDLAEGVEQVVIGVSVPVWYFDGKTSEPANEVFCKYIIKISDAITDIKYEDDAYVIRVAKNFSNEETKERSPVIVKNILDIKDGGSEWLAFRQLSKTKKNKRLINMANFVEIKDMNVLLETLC